MVNGRVLGIAAVIALLGAACGGGGGHAKSCTGGTDPRGNPCVADGNCDIACVCQREGEKPFTETAGLCKQNAICQGAQATCTESCLVLAATWTGNFCNRK